MLLLLFLSGSELGAAYIWLSAETEEEEIDLLNWWSNMVEIPSIAKANTDVHLKAIALQAFHCCTC